MQILQTQLHTRLGADGVDDVSDAEWPTYRFFLKGVGGSGKSTLLNELAGLLPDGQVGVLGLDVEARYPLNVLKVADVVASEAKPGFEVMDCATRSTTPQRDYRKETLRSRSHSRRRRRW